MTVPTQIKGNILILDDEKTNIDIIRRELKSEYMVYYALNATNAFEILEHLPIQLILLDIVMPEMNGFDFFKALQENQNYKNIRVIFITAEKDINTIVKGFEIGAVDYISKPFELLELKARVKTHMDLIIAHEELEKAKNDLVILNSTKDRLFSIIGHDLRNPIGGIKTYLELLVHQKEISPDNLQKTLQILLDSSTTAYSLLNELLVWAKAQKNEITIDRQQHSIREILIHIKSLFDETARKKNIELNLNLENAIIGYFDIEMFKTILRNLIANAIKFTPENGSVTIAAYELAEEIQIQIIDTGIGIPKENISKLFDKKSFITTEDTTNTKGTGLGLSICQEFVAKHKGKIWIESKVGKGSKFCFTLPKES